MHSKRIQLATLIALLIAATGSPIGANAQQLNGAGSTFLTPIMGEWTRDYLTSTGITVNYQSIGSGAGVNYLIRGMTDFAGSDAPMSDREMKLAGEPIVHIPVVIGTECVAYNVPGISTGLHLNGTVIADIYLGTISMWDDAGIAKLNPTTHLPHQAIQVVHRSDSSGTTYIWTDYLSKVSPVWHSRVGVGKSVRWPLGDAERGNQGVALAIKQTPYAIGYIELAYAMRQSIPFAAIRNASGKFILPSPESGSAAVDEAKVPPDMRVSITNTSADKGYPITGFSWLILEPTSPRAADVKAFVRWVLTRGQAYAIPAGYAPLPSLLLTRAKDSLASSSSIAGPRNAAR